MDVLSFLTGLREATVTVAAVAGIIIAYKGLTTWKKELKGRSNHETAKTVLSATFHVRKAIHIVRNNWISPDENPLTPNVTDGERFSHIFKKRWEVLQEALKELEYAKIQGQALWGKDFEKCFEDLYSVVRELNYSINQYIELLKKTSSESTQSEILQLKRIIFHVPVLDAKHDSYASRLYKAIKHIEGSVREHL